MCASLIPSSVSAQCGLICYKMAQSEELGRGQELSTWIVIDMSWKKLDVYLHALMCYIVIGDQCMLFFVINLYNILCMRN